MNLKGSNEVMGKSIETAWLMWFSKIQELHKAGTLGGVIIDLRGNGGGMLNDYQFVMGALLPSGGFTTNLLRYKRGTARLDYSPLMPQVMPTLPSEHAVVTEPIVVLGDCNSVSMAEVTARSCKLIPNACFIGKRTWGALCGLNENPYFSVNYSGHIGVRRQTSVYVYTPMMASFSMDGKQLEGVGIEPDIEVDLDTKLFNANTSDTQLERALQYIRTGN
jgi:C-terminal processing protease CtpA/Prc